MGKAKVKVTELTEKHERWNHSAYPILPAQLMGKRTITFSVHMGHTALALCVYRLVCMA